MAESGTGHSGPLRLYIVGRRLSAFIGFIEVIDMQNSEQEWMKQYRELLEAKTVTLRAMPAEKRMALRQQWIDLHEEIIEGPARVCNRGHSVRGACDRSPSHSARRTTSPGATDTEGLLARHGLSVLRRARRQIRKPIRFWSSD